MVQLHMYADILNHLPDCICVIDVRTNNVQYVNETFSKQILTRGIIFGQTFESKILHDDVQDRFLKIIEEVKSSPNSEIAIGLCKTLSTSGKYKCKYNPLLFNGREIFN